MFKTKTKTLKNESRDQDSSLKNHNGSVCAPTESEKTIKDMENIHGRPWRPIKLTWRVAQELLVTVHNGEHLSPNVSTGTRGTEDSHKDGQITRTRKPLVQDKWIFTDTNNYRIFPQSS